MAKDYLDLLGFDEKMYAEEQEEETIEKRIAGALDANEKKEHIDNYYASFFNTILGDPVLLYALENGKWNCLRDVNKDGIAIPEYDALKQEMEETRWKFNLEGSMAQKILGNYTYYRAVEHFDVKLLEHLRTNTITFNEIQAFASRHSIDLVVGGLWAKKYPEWAESKKIG